ncbi:MAG: hypothetical protein QOE63_1993, partial [Acidimicrobiaceae bacterium]
AALDGFELSSVKPGATAGSPADVVLVGGSLHGIPKTLVGKLRTPQAAITNDEPSISFAAQPSLGQIELAYRNYLDPDLFGAVPTSHNPFGDVLTQQIALQQHGDRIKAHLEVVGLQSATYRPVRAADGTPLDTKVIKLGFLGTQTAHAFLDVAKSPTDHLLSDIALFDIPSDVDVCLRADHTAGAPAAATGEGTWCDSLAGDQGGVRVHTDHPTSGIDIDAYARQEAAGLPELAARLVVTDLPPTLQVILPAGASKAFAVDGLQSDGTTAQGIGQVVAELTKGGDIDADGWANDQSRPFTRRALPEDPILNFGTPFPAPAPSNHQHLSLAKANDLLQVKASIGDRTPGVPGSEVEHISVLDDHCAAFAGRPDFPAYPPADATTSYQCIAASFSDSTLAQADPLDLSVADGFAGGGAGTTSMRLHEAGLTDVPKSFQMTLADTPVTAGADEALRTPCGTVQTTTTPPAAGSCMPPLVRFDQPAPGPQLFGSLETGDADVLNRLAKGELAPKALEAPDLTSVPSQPGITVQQLAPDDTGLSATTVRFRLDVPQSLTLQQPQSWKHDDGTVVDAEGHTSAAQSAKDIRFAYAMHDAAGNADTAPAGTFALYSLDGSKETVISDPSNFAQGLSIPKELGLAIYVRDSAEKGATFLQLDGRTSRPLDAALQMFDHSVRPDEIAPADEPTNYANQDVSATGLERTTLKLLQLPAIDPTAPVDQPSFRIRFEKFGAPKGATTTSGADDGTRKQILGSLDAALTFLPGTRRVEGALFMNAPLIGLEVAAFGDVDSPDATAPKTEATMTADLFFDKLVFHHQAGDDQEDVVSNLRLAVDVTQFTDFRARNNVAGLSIDVSGPN